MWSSRPVSQVTSLEFFDWSLGNDAHMANSRCEVCSKRPFSGQTESDLGHVLWEMSNAVLLKPVLIIPISDLKSQDVLAQISCFPLCLVLLIPLSVYRSSVAAMGPEDRAVCSSGLQACVSTTAYNSDRPEVRPTQVRRLRGKGHPFIYSLTDSVV